MESAPDSRFTHEAYAFAEAYVAEDAILTAARKRGVESGLTPIRPGGGAALRALAAATQAKAIVEVGTGTGVSGLWLLRGMRATGTLTTMDSDSTHQEYARKAFMAAGFPAGRTRLINGHPLRLLPRLTDNAYDLMFVDGDKREYPNYVHEAQRLLRPGGVVVFDNALRIRQTTEPHPWDPETLALRETMKSLQEGEDFHPFFLPLSHGLLAGVKI